MTLRIIIHLMLHVAAPGIAAGLAFKERWKSAWGIMVLTMVVDLDHLLASPVYDPGRCSIGFHPLHSWPALLIYLIMLLIPPLRILGAGLLIHMAVDATDCLWMIYL